MTQCNCQGCKQERMARNLVVVLIVFMLIISLLCEFVFSAIPPTGADGPMAPLRREDPQNSRSMNWEGIAASSAMEDADLFGPPDPPLRVVRHGEVLREWASVYGRTTNRAFRDHYVGQTPHGYTADLNLKQYSYLLAKG